MSLVWDVAAWEKAVFEFNSAAYFECHETLEAWWLQADEPLKTFLQGIIQVAAGLIKLKEGNLKGCKQLLGRGQNKIATSLNKDITQNCPLNIAKIQRFQAKIECIQTLLNTLAELDITMTQTHIPRIDF